MVNHNNYTLLNYLAFNYAGFACISIIVFLSSTQPFYIKEVLELENAKIGGVIGILGFIDELTSMISAPFIGALNDKLNTISGGGSRIVPSIAFLVISIALAGYSVCSKFSELMLFRAIFALGVTGCMSMITVLLNEVGDSDFKLTFKRREILLGHEEEEEEVEAEPERKKNGKFSALIGISTGIGAIFAVSVFVPLPIKLGDKFQLDIKSSLEWAYLVVSGFAIFSFMILIIWLYRTRSNVNSTHENYFELLRHGFEFSRINHQVKLAYAGAFVARSTTVAMAVFIPLMVYDWYYNKGQCKSNDQNTGNLTCHEGYVFSAILTGIAQTIALVSAPFWGFLIDFRKVKSRSTPLKVAALFGLVGNFLFCFSNTTNPKTVTCFLSVCILGVSQIGLIISSMSVLTGISDVHEIMGSLSGFYSFCGGLGILSITLLGGFLSDLWILGPFFILGTFNAALLVICHINRDEKYQGESPLLLLG
ncbi:uncharacterized protein SPAPADRAFT_138901 [Spathaspora passalidarum NRRL Y-27907]|uniref:Major facilitator superfamily (MFS) profile domain-containing protein n=1 Tax=Spathaspora passalidarum (strain NRRL Y-27907 / 11-Y1) TaxID=619300 RepID=G3AQ33_SPAPN|nr:uncharacterized protein SPAPADRAFT_138901 [Spathaspora passalidarum NRRL Y-27907]EGW32354.1 hypothetical protein SPAPADRAFT_138901 [Spathaspora passalidarum NRRL Y-27907]